MEFNIQVHQYDVAADRWHPVEESYPFAYQRIAAVAVGPKTYVLA